MARKRMVSPGLLVSDQVAALPVRARYAFVALWMYLDDEGRGKDNPMVICAHTWPQDKTMTPRTMQADLDAMATQGLICRYTVAGVAYLHCPTWHEHQKISRPTKSTLPVCSVNHSLNDSLNDSRSDSGPIEVKRIEGEEKLDEVKRASDLTSRSAALTKRYLDAQPLANRIRVQSAIAQAIGDGGYADEAVAAALDRLAAAPMNVTPATLLVELNAKAKTKTSTSDSRVAQALEVAARFAEKETQVPAQRAIGAGT